MLGLGKFCALAAALIGAAALLPPAMRLIADADANQAAWLPRGTPSVAIHWVGEGGAVETRRGEDLKTQWIWLPGDPDQRHSPLDPPDPRRYPGAPAVEVRFETRAIPAGWQLAKSAGEGADLLSIEPTGGPDAGLKTVVVALKSELATISLDFDASSRSRHLTLVLATREVPPAIIVHRSCAGLFRLELPSDDNPRKKLEAAPVSGGTVFGGSAEDWNKAGGHAEASVNPRHLYVALACARDDSAVYFHLLRSDDARWGYAAKPAANSSDAGAAQSTQIDTSDAHFTYRVYREDARLIDHNPILEVRTRDEQDRLLSVDLLCVNNSADCNRNPKWTDD